MNTIERAVKILSGDTGDMVRLNNLLDMCIRDQMEHGLSLVETSTVMGIRKDTEVYHPIVMTLVFESLSDLQAAEDNEGDKY